MKRFALTSMIAAALLLVACGPAVETPTLDTGAEPAETAGLAPNGVRPGEVVDVPGLFRFQVPIGYTYELNGNGTVITDALQNTIIFLTVLPPNAEGESFSMAFFDQMTGSLDLVNLAAGEDIELDQVAGSSQPFDAMADSLEAAGRYVVLSFDNGLEFAAFAVSPQLPNNDLWTLEGEAAFDLILGSISFDPALGQGTACVVSQDANYAYGLETPVRVGGDFDDGPQRAARYLDALGGPDGETVDYERLGSTVNEKGDVVHAYELAIEGGDSTERIYVDYGRHEPLYAPAGLTCGNVFDLDSP